jgi:hypothetical protein
VLLADLTGFEHAVPSPQLVEQISRLGLLQPVVVAGSPRERYRVWRGGAARRPSCFSRPRAAGQPPRGWTP